MANISEFTKMLKDEVESRLGGRYYINQSVVFKNNSCRYTALTIHDKENTNDIRMEPTYYAEDFYEKYTKGVSIPEIAEMIRRSYENLEYPEMIDTSKLNKDDLKKKVFYKLINSDKNRDMLADSPHIDFLDLSLVFYYLCEKKVHDLSCFRISNSIIEDISDVTADDLYEYAQNNMPVLFPEKIEQMWKVLYRNSIRKGREADEEMLQCLSANELYILSNEEGMNGASAILYGKKMYELAETIESNLFILPSSIHEVILVPANDRYDAHSLMRMVSEVNRTAVSPQDFLADNVYYYSRDSKRILSCI